MKNRPKSKDFLNKKFKFENLIVINAILLTVLTTEASLSDIEQAGLNDSLPTNTSFKNLPLFSANTTTPLFSQEEDEFKPYNQAWLHKKLIKGYIVVSDDIKFSTKLLKKKKYMKIRIPVGSARIVEIQKHRRDVEVRINTWNKVNRVRVRVPFGFTPDELKIVEKPKSIIISGPYGFIEFRNADQEKMLDLV